MNYMTVFKQKGHIMTLRKTPEYKFFIRNKKKTVKGINTIILMALKYTCIRTF